MTLRAIQQGYGRRIGLLLMACVVGMTAQAAPQATASRPAARRTPAGATLTVQDVVKMLQAKVPETMVLSKIKKNAKPIDLSPDDMVLLKNSGASDNVLTALMDPTANVGDATSSASPASSTTPPPPVANSSTTSSTSASSAASTSGKNFAHTTSASTPTTSTTAPVVPVANTSVANTPTPAVTAPAGSKKRLAVEEFDYSTVMTAVQSVFNTNQNIGKGIRSMMVKRLDASGSYTIVERAKIDTILKEQDFGASNRVKAGTNARIGRIKGADAILMGDIVIFGRDDKKNSAAAAAALPGIFGAIGRVHKEDKAVVAIDYRLVDAESTEVIASGEARGESLRKSNNWGALLAGTRAAGGAAVDMESKNFEETIIGEATMDCVTKLSEILKVQAPKLVPRRTDVETRVADISGSTIILAAGANDGIQAGDKFSIERIVREVRDPVTKEVLDLVTSKVGEVVVTTVRDKISTGNFIGSSRPQVNDAAKKM